MDEARRRGAAEQPAKPNLRRRGIEQVLTADDEVDPVAEVVDDDAEAVRPVAMTVPDGHVAGAGNRAWPRSEHGVVPGLVALAERHAPDQTWLEAESS